jgi:hypothetical protein
MTSTQALCTTPLAPPSTPTPGRLTTWDAIVEFMWAGNAKFTLVSGKTGLRFTYRLRVKKEDVAANLADPVYFLSLLRGSDNEADYVYVGVIRRKECALRLTPASKVGNSAQSVQACAWFLRQLRVKADVLGDDAPLLQFWHTGRCGKCGRLLTVPGSVLLGLGPVCDGRMEAA